MSRILPNHFKRSGAAKKGYDTKSAARREAERSNKRAYKCGFCGQYHVGGRGDA